QAIVYKTSQANIADGGLAGTINVTTRKPLSQKEKFSGSVSVGATYADLPGRVSPDMNGNVTWQNDAGTVGVIIRASRKSATAGATRRRALRTAPAAAGTSSTPRR
ncbi:MAG TPA: hypothetical protein VFS02_07525, partial [Telluria sp.]|nr:hypothetical protein [Telluria sp.]